MNQNQVHPASDQHPASRKRRADHPITRILHPMLLATAVLVVIGCDLLTSNLATSDPDLDASQDPNQGEIQTEEGPLPSETTAQVAPQLIPTPIGTSLPPIGEDITACDLTEQSAALLPEYQREIEQLASATRYSIDVRIEFDPETYGATIEGTAGIHFTNTSGKPLDEMVLVLWPNHSQYFSQMIVNSVSIGDQLVEAQPEQDGLVARIPLPQPLLGGESIDLGVNFSVEAYAPITETNQRRFGITQGVLVAPTFYPLVPRLDDGSWQEIVAPAGGDPTVSDTAFYCVRVTAPADYQIITSGVETEQLINADGTKSVWIVSGPMRDFALAVGRLELNSKQVDGVTVRSWTLPAHSGTADRMLNNAARQLGFLNEMIGQYPYVEFDIVDAPNAFIGLEYPGLVFHGILEGKHGDLWEAQNTVHEVAHQWFYGLIGNDQVREPWLDEALTNYVGFMYFEKAGQPQETEGILNDCRIEVGASSTPEQPIGLAVEDYATEDDYGIFVYYKGALFVEALRRRFGDADFTELLQAYYNEYRFGFASGPDFQAVAEGICGCNLNDFFDLWVREGGMGYE